MNNGLLNFTGEKNWVEVPNEDLVIDDTFSRTSIMNNEFSIRPYTALDGVIMLEMLKINDPASREWAKEPEAKGPAFSAIYEGKLVACAGIVKEREGVGLAWALYPSSIGNYHIDPRIAKNMIRELMDKHGFWRVAATVRCDFPAGASYLRYLGFEREGRLKQNEPDRTDSYLYAMVKNEN